MEEFFDSARNHISLRISSISRHVTLFGLIAAVLHVAVASLLLYISMVQHREANQFLVDNRYGMTLYLFQPADPTDPSLVTNINTIADFMSYVQTTTERYYSIANGSVGVVQHYADPASGAPLPPTLTLTYFDAFDVSSEQRVRVFNLSADNPTWMFDNVTSSGLLRQRESCSIVNGQYFSCRNDAIADFFDLLIHARLDMVLRSQRYHAGAPSGVVQWRFAVEFEVTSHDSVIVATVYATSREYWRAPLSDYAPLLALIPLALMEMCVQLHSMAWGTAMSHRRLSVVNVSEQVLGERSLIRPWAVFIVVADVLAVVYGIVSLSERLSMTIVRTDVIPVGSTIVLGFSVAMSVVGFLAYMQHIPRFYVLMRSLSILAPHIVRYIVGIAPLFMGFALCGVAVFGPLTTYFRTVPMAMETLFCMINGDSILNSSMLVAQTNFGLLRAFSHIYVCVFLALFICNVLNIALAIVQESYAHVKEMYELCEQNAERTDAQLTKGAKEATNGAGGDIPAESLRALRDSLRDIIAVAQGTHDAEVSARTLS